MSRTFFDIFDCENDIRVVTSRSHGGFHERRLRWVHTGNARKGKFQISFCVADPNELVSVLNWILCGTPDNQNVTLITVKKIRFAHLFDCRVRISVVWSGSAPRWAALRRHVPPSTGLLAAVWTEEYFPSRLPIADSGSLPRAVPWLVRFCMTRLEQATLWPITDWTLGSYKVEAKKLSADETKRRFCLLLRLPRRFVSSSGSCIWRHIVLKNICLVAADLVSLTE